MKRRKFDLMDTTKEFVGSGIAIGAGSSILGAMGQGQIAGQVITPAANMLGPLATAKYGMSIIDTFSEGHKSLQKKSSKYNL